MSTETVRKLHLSTESYPTPYKLTSLNKDNKVIIDKHYLVSFSMGQNKFNSVWCDLMSMNACHIILRRP